jgi:outer membrane receptor protein involved in Fe transport
MTTVPELLRLVPGLQVAEINANKWAISSRGFNGLFSNKLLVLVDGRSIYDPLNSGQFLETEDLILEDIDRIEVLRGPAGAIWGADAVNGVVNIITKPASDTQDASVRLSAGTLERVQGEVQSDSATRRAAADIRRLRFAGRQPARPLDTFVGDRYRPAGAVILRQPSPVRCGHGAVTAEDQRSGRAVPDQALVSTRCRGRCGIPRSLRVQLTFRH